MKESGEGVKGAGGVAGRALHLTSIRPSDPTSPSGVAAMYEWSWCTHSPVVATAHPSLLGLGHE